MIVKVEKILKMIQFLKENPDISARELSKLLNMNIRTVYRHINQFQQFGILTGPSDLRGKTQPVVYDEVTHLNLAFTQPQLSLIYRSIETRLQGSDSERLSESLNEAERQTLEQAKGLISKALWVKPEAAPASINFAPESTMGKTDKGKNGGEISIGFVGKLGKLEMKNPLHMVSSINANLLPLIFSSLFYYFRGKPEGLVVKSWEVSDDLLTWNFELKEGIKFHNGSELTAEDVEYTYRSIADPGFGSLLAPTHSIVRSFEAISKYKFRIKLKNPHIALLDMLCIPILPKEALKRCKQLKRLDPKMLLIGSGPFRFDSFPQDDVMILKANENYFEEGYPRLEKVILKAYPTSRELFDAAAPGEVDLVIFGLSVSEFEQLGKTIPFRTYPVDMEAYYTLLFNLKDETLSDVRVRKAISHAIDRESLIKIQLMEYGEVSNGPWTPFSWAYNENLQPVKYDVELAKSLLAEAGWNEKGDHWQKRNERLEIEIAVPQEIPDLVRLAVGVRLQLSKLKVKVKIKYITISEIAPNRYMSMLLSINCGADPDKLWRFWHSGSPINLTSYHNLWVDELLDWGRSIVPITKRKAIYNRLQELIVSDHPAAFLCTSVSLIGSNYVLQNADEFLNFPCFFSSIKSWTIKRGETK